MKRICPGASQYAVMRMDPVAMVEHFGDRKATRQAKTLSPKTYLVYLDNALDLPFPKSAWFRYEVSPIGTTLRPEEPERGITEDMAIPICPNERCLSGRLPVRTETPFPFGNCYHWVDTQATVRVRRHLDMYDESNAVKVSSLEHIRMEKAFCEDCDRIDDFAEAQEREASVSPSHSRSGRSYSPSSQDSRLSDRSTEQSDCSDSSGRSGSGDADDSSTDTRSDNERRGGWTLDDIYRLDVFNLSQDVDDEFFPLVDLWFELGDHLSEDAIPSPTEFDEERKAIARIILDARQRNRAARLPSRNGEPGYDYDVLSEGEEDDIDFYVDPTATPAEKIIPAKRKAEAIDDSLRITYARSFLPLSLYPSRMNDEQDDDARSYAFSEDIYPEDEYSSVSEDEIWCGSDTPYSSGDDVDVTSSRSSLINIPPSRSGTRLVRGV
ncbi:hypothetical protein C8Q79DRAFT_751798 [Trametes meyenii]|nr:hypothetical protein C8Q79DRAFT_751798 [Trametes meyenii]